MLFDFRDGRGGLGFLESEASILDAYSGILLRGRRMRQEDESHRRPAMQILAAAPAHLSFQRVPLAP